MGVWIKEWCTPADTLIVGDAPAGAASDPFGTFLLVANEGAGTLSLIQTSSAPPDV